MAREELKREIEKERAKLEDQKRLEEMEWGYELINGEYKQL